MSKQLMRKNMKDKLSRLDSDLYILYSEQIKTNFIKEISSLNVHTIGLTISAFPEVNTEGIIHALWELGRTVVVPKCTPQDRSMTFYRIEDYNQLETVYMNLKEPNPKLTTAVEPSSIDLLIVPGIVYSKSGYRIGYGGGYYDRFLSNYKGKSMSLAFDMQLVDVIVSEDFDLPVDSIITERTTIMCKENREMGELT